MNRFLKLSLMTTLAGVVGACNSTKMEYPAAPTDESVTDEYFGTTVADPYRPLENDTAPATLEWVKAENALTEAYLSEIPFREKIRERLTALNNYKKTGLPSKEKDGKYYFYENNGLQNQSVLYRSDSIGGKPEVFLDPNTLSGDGIEWPSRSVDLKRREIYCLYNFKKRF